jgi:hypothetical protein
MIEFEEIKNTVWFDGMEFEVHSFNSETRHLTAESPNCTYLIVPVPIHIHLVVIPKVRVN